MNSLQIQNIVNLINGGKYEDAEGLLKPVLDKSPANRNARYLRGAALAKMGKLEDAEAVFLDLAANDSRNIEALTALALIYRKQNRLKDATGVFNDAIDIDPTRAEVRVHGLREGHRVQPRFRRRIQQPRRCLLRNEGKQQGRQYPQTGR